MTAPNNETAPAVQEQDHDQEREVAVADQTLQMLMRADLDVKISTAKAYPRSLKAFRDEVLSTVQLSQEVAESCSYELPRGTNPGDTVSGPSVRFAEILVAAYGNNACGARVTLNDGRRIRAQGVFHDLQKNTSITIEVTRSIMQHEYEWRDVNGRRKKVRTGRLVPMSEDMQTLAGNAACSIAYRNAALKGIPRVHWWDAYETAKRVALGDEKTLGERRAKAVEWFVGKGITVEQICAVLDVAGVEEIDLVRLGKLSGFKAAVVNREADITAIFPPVVPPETKGTAATKEAEEKLRKKKDADAGNAK